MLRTSTTRLTSVSTLDARSTWPCFDSRTASTGSTNWNHGLGMYRYMGKLKIIHKHFMAVFHSRGNANEHMQVYACAYTFIHMYASLHTFALLCIYQHISAMYVYICSFALSLSLLFSSFLSSLSLSLCIYIYTHTLTHSLTHSLLHMHVATSSWLSCNHCGHPPGCCVSTRSQRA